MFAGSEYIMYIKSGRRLEDLKGSGVYLRSTREWNLLVPNGRSNAAKAILALLFYLRSGKASIECLKNLYN